MQELVGSTLVHNYLSGPPHRSVGTVWDMTGVVKLCASMMVRASQARLRCLRLRVRDVMLLFDDAKLGVLDSNISILVINKALLF